MSFSDTSTSTKNYYGTVAGALCLGPLDELIAVLVNSEEYWPRGTAWESGKYCTAGKAYVFDGQTWVCSAGHYASQYNAPDGSDTSPGWVEYGYGYSGSPYTDLTLISADDTTYGTMTFYWGTAEQVADVKLLNSGNDYYQQHPNYLGVVYIVIKDFLLGTEVSSAPNIEIVVRRRTRQPIITGTPTTIVDGQVNLACVAAEILTSKNCLGLPAEMIDAPSFQAVAEYLQTNEKLYGASVLIDTSEEVTSVFDKLIQMIDGYIRFNPVTMKIELGMYKHGVVPTEGYVTLTADSFTKIPKFTQESWQKAYSRATVSYNSRQLNYAQTSTYSDDSRVFSILGSIRDMSLERAWIARGSQAILHGIESLKTVGLAQMKGDLEVRREIGRNIRSGDYVMVNIDLEPNTNRIFKFFRVDTRTIPPTGPITLSVIGDNTMASVLAYIHQQPVVPNPIAAANPFVNLRFTEVPYDLSQSKDSVVCLAQRPEKQTAYGLLWFETPVLTGLTVTSIVADGTGLLGIITFATAHTLIVGEKIDVGGAVEAAFNSHEAAITAVTAYTVTYPLNTAVASALVATTTTAFKVCNYNGTFENIGIVSNFAALGFLSASVDIEDGVLGVNVDESQADADYFTKEVSVNTAENDQMLLFVVEKAAAPDADQIAEDSGGCVKIEIMSVARMEKDSTFYTLTCLRGRRGTTIQAFSAGAEAWLIPKSYLVYFQNGMFSQLRANRAANTVPDRALFRLQARTVESTYPLADVANVSFRFQNCTNTTWQVWIPPGYKNQEITVSCVGGTVTTEKILVKA